MTSPIIRTPQGVIMVNKNQKAVLNFQLSFFQKKFSAAQKFVDSEVLRRCEPYIPLLTGMMILSGLLGTEIGSGTVSWIAPYSRYQYYLPKEIGTQTGPLRGPFWFERMKMDHGAEIVEGARRIVGGENVRGFGK